jgi:hypothetical protein
VGRRRLKELIYLMCFWVVVIRRWRVMKRVNARVGVILIGVCIIIN